MPIVPAAPVTTTVFREAHGCGFTRPDRALLRPKRPRARNVTTRMKRMYIDMSDHSEA
jgi:hypothetical protein